MERPACSGCPPRNHQWRKKEIHPLFEELMKEPFVLREKGSATRDILEIYLRNQNQSSLGNSISALCWAVPKRLKKQIIAGLARIDYFHLCYQTGVGARDYCWKIRLEGCNIERDFYLIHQKHTWI